jgi:hypothetical protein
LHNSHFFLTFGISVRSIWLAVEKDWRKGSWGEAKFKDGFQETTPTLANSNHPSEARRGP